MKSWKWEPVTRTRNEDERNSPIERGILFSDSLKVHNTRLSRCCPEEDGIDEIPAGAVIDYLIIVIVRAVVAARPDRK